ncbi:PepSY domain-containing protein [Roseospira goensis]|uniref:PepSY domain-containing protein n=1 Tax=Roseospira goensis TaxID=391922 RepID=A0A7W6WKD6_9PROT|nr:PepSY domain-containing protein [Roseospira goensis]MBB4285478.1 hypothetical protein [Roseospira goensis]
MRPTLIAAATATALTLAAVPALASSTDVQGTTAPRSAWMSVGQVANMFTSRGLDVRSVDTYRDHYEVEFIDAQGVRMEAYVDPVTGKVLRQERDD